MKAAGGSGLSGAEIPEFVRRHVSSPGALLSAFEALISSHDLHGARQFAYLWLQEWIRGLPAAPQRQHLLQPELYQAIGDVMERTNDHYIVERLWQLLDSLPFPPHPETSPAPGGSGPSGPLPLLGVPVLNRPDLLHRLLDSLDHPVHTLAVVDNSPAGSQLSAELAALQQLGHPWIESIRIARPFTNLGVAASWNLILTSFPQAPCSLLINNDIQLASGVLAASLALINPSRPQFLPLLPDPQGFSAFLITALCWDRLGLFDANFHPAYGEDLDYRDRLRAAADVDQVDGRAFHGAMADCNHDHSATIGSDPSLERQNRCSFALNRLWYFSHRRLRHDPRGSWRRLWLNQWTFPAPEPQPTSP